MKNLTARIGLALMLISIALGTTACDQATIDGNMAKAKDVARAIRNGAAVTASAIREGVDAACANQPTVYAAAMASRVLLTQQTGPNTTQNVANLDRALASYNNACAAASNPNATNTAALLGVAISAYASVQAAQAKAGG